MSVSHNRDYSVSSARFIAMCFIIICHMMQRDDFASDINGAHISWAFWFNVGVQMFLFLSGYLYSGKDNIDTVPFYKKNFPKLLTDYYVFIVIMLVVMNFSSLPGVSTPPPDRPKTLIFYGLPLFFASKMPDTFLSKSISDPDN